MRSRSHVPGLGIAIVLAACAASACDKKPQSGHSASSAEPTAVAPSSAAGSSTVSPRPAGPAYDESQLLVFAALPAKAERSDNPFNDAKIALGRQLFFDARLSKGQDVSCNSCHDVTRPGGDDGEAISAGTHQVKGTRNTPTILDVADSSTQGWSALGSDVEGFVVAHAEKPTMMASSAKALADMVTSIPAYGASFKKAFPDEKGAITADTIAFAIAAYVRQLLTPSRWDTFLGGDRSALTDEEKRGLGAFMDANCTSCHAGKYLGTGSSKKLGVAKPWPNLTDPGRFAVTGEENDRFVFKVPTLRNVTKTGPWLHDGSVASLDEMVKQMARYQVGRELTDAQTKAIVTFLGALAGDAPKELVKKPDLPPSGPKTPKHE